MGSTDRTRIGIIGCGWIAGQGHLPALTRMQGVDVVAIADPDAGALERTGNAFGVTRRYRDAAELVAQNDVELVGVLVPAAAHLQVAGAALRAGKPVLLEKPPALNLDEWDTFATEIRAAGAPFMLGLNMRWYHAFRSARELVRSGAVGEIQAIRTVLAHNSHEERAEPDWRRHRETGGGALIETGVHHFDLWRFLTDSGVKEVSVRTRGSDESVAVAGVMRSGAVASSLFSQGTSQLNEVEVLGTRAVVRATPYAAPLVTAVSSMPWTLRSKRLDISASLSLKHARAGRRGGGFFVSSFVGMWAHFLQSVRNGAGLETGLDSSRELLQVVLAAAASADSGRAVSCETAPHGFVDGAAERDPR
jgi:predicted dehydrogenase